MLPGMPSYRVSHHLMHSVAPTQMLFALIQYLLHQCRQPPVSCSLLIVLCHASRPHSPVIPKSGPTNLLAKESLPVSLHFVDFLHPCYLLTLPHLLIHLTHRPKNHLIPHHPARLYFPGTVCAQKSIQMNQLYPCFL